MGRPVVQVVVRVVAALPATPSGNETEIRLPDAAERRGMGMQVVREDSGEMWLIFERVKVCLRLEEPYTAEIYTCHPRELSPNFFEDVLFIALAPLLRRCGYYLTHAFGAVRGDTAVLVVGPMGSGKTTTGLRLLLDGWHLLSNDAVLLHEREGRVYALPTPGLLSIRPPTYQLLPELSGRVPTGWRREAERTVMSATQLAGLVWAKPTPVGKVCFPRVEARPFSQLLPQNRAIGLVQLMEESIDRWDPAFIDPHMEVLRQLVAQSDLYTLHLGRDMQNLSDLIGAC